MLATHGPATDPSRPMPPGFARQIVAHVPEPAQWWLMLAGLAGLAAMVRRRAQHRAAVPPQQPAGPGTYSSVVAGGSTRCISCRAPGRPAAAACPR